MPNALRYFLIAVVVLFLLANFDTVIKAIPTLIDSLTRFMNSMNAG